MTVRLKPNGTARIIIDLGWPRGKLFILGNSVPISPNASMEGLVNFEKVTMTSDRFFQLALYRSGKEALITNADWDFAFKHCSVRPEDHHLMLVNFGGRYFVKKCLTFGAANSPYIYRLAASFLIEVAELHSGMDSRNNVMQLDDNCTVGLKNCPVL